MLFYVTRMRVKGRPLTPAQLHKGERLRCCISIQHESHLGMGRATVVARVGGSAGPLDASPIPELLEVSLHSMAPNGMVLSGVEQIDGVSYAQSWLCRQE